MLAMAVYHHKSDPYEAVAFVTLVACRSHQRSMSTRRVALDEDE